MCVGVYLCVCVSLCLCVCVCVCVAGLSLGERSEPHMGDTSGIFHIYNYYYRTYVGVCVTPFFFFGVRCAQYKVHAQCSFAALAPHMPCMLLVIMVLLHA